MDRILEHTLLESISRAVILSRILAVTFALYGFSSLEFIRQFHPEITWSQNFWPRVALASVPLLLLSWWAQYSSCSPRVRLLGWVTGFALVLHVAAWIHVWPIALEGSVQVLLYVQPINLFLVAAVYAAVAPPTRYLLQFSMVLMVLFHAPLLWIAARGGDKVLFWTLVGDLALALPASMLLSVFADRVRRRIAALEINREQQASRFLGSHLSKAIYSGEVHRLDRVRCRGFVLSVDIRDSTELQMLHGESWLSYRREYFKLVAQLAARHSGHIQKTVGDCHIINFGVMDYGAQISGACGQNSERERADEARLQRASHSVFSFVDELFSKNDELSRAHFKQSCVSLGAGVDKGWVERAVHGHEEHQLELDVNGDPVNCSNRLQEYSKLLRQERKWYGSVLIASPFACDYLDSVDAFQRVMVGGGNVRNFPGIRWVLVRVHEPEAERLVKQAA